MGQITALLQTNNNKGNGVWGRFMAMGKTSPTTATTATTTATQRQIPSQPQTPQSQPSQPQAQGTQPSQPSSSPSSPPPLSDPSTTPTPTSTPDKRVYAALTQRLETLRRVMAGAALGENTPTPPRRFTLSNHLPTPLLPPTSCHHYQRHVYALLNYVQLLIHNMTLR